MVEPINHFSDEHLSDSPTREDGLKRMSDLELDETYVYWQAEHDRYHAEHNGFSAWNCSKTLSSIQREKNHRRSLP